MSAEVWATAAFCVLLAGLLAAGAWPQLALLRRVFRPPWPRRRAGGVRLEGVVVSDGDAVQAPLSGRSVLWVRAQVLGPSAQGGGARKLWARVLSVPLSLEPKEGHPKPRLALDMAHAVVVVTREYRVGTVKALAPQAPNLPRVLSRAGWSGPPPKGELFLLQEELVPAGISVLALGELGEDGVLRGTPGAPLVLTTLSAGRLALRLGGGAALALLLAFLQVLVALTVTLTAHWLR